MTNTNGGIFTAAGDQETTFIPTIVIEQCSNCKSVRRRSLYEDEDEQRISKKPNLSPQLISSATATATGASVTTQLADQLTKIHISPPSTLRRTISAPNPHLVSPTFLNPNSPETHNKNQSPVTEINLHRCVSDPSPILNFPVYSPETKTITTSSPASATKTPKPSLPPTRRQILRRRKRTSSVRSRKMGEELSKGESPYSSKEPNQMQEIMNVRNQCFSQAVQEVDDQQEASEITHNTANPKESKSEEEEAVSVEKIGECLVIEFKCDCSKTYQILLYGDACYYKLI